MSVTWMIQELLKQAVKEFLAAKHPTATLRDQAELLGVSAPLLSEWFRDERSISIESAEKFLHILGGDFTRALPGYVPLPTTHARWLRKAIVIMSKSYDSPDEAAAILNLPTSEFDAILRGKKSPAPSLLHPLRLWLQREHDRAPIGSDTRMDIFQLLYSMPTTAKGTDATKPSARIEIYKDRDGDQEPHYVSERAAMDDLIDENQRLREQLAEQDKALKAISLALSKVK